jgi:hypothetical protein
MLLDKTDKGRDEIATRHNGLPPRMRTLLLLIDGKHPIEELLDKLAGIGLTEEHLKELIEGEYVYDTAPPPPPPDEIPAEVLATKEQEQLDAIYSFYTESIRTAAGLRGYALQARADRARTLEDFRALRVPFLELVLRTQGEKEARRLRDQLDPLLIMSPATITGMHV